MILVDNLDKAWNEKRDILKLSNFIFGLFNVSSDVAGEFRRSGPAWRSVRLSLVIFIRSDIFSFVMSQAREEDKIAHTRINWTDTELLRRVIEERFVRYLPKNSLNKEVWSQFFVDRVRGLPTRDYTVSRIIPRPRDIIYLCKAALANAVNRRHTIIQEDDILQAEQDYSKWVYGSLMSEIESQLERAEALFYEFMGSNEVVTRDKVIAYMARAGIPESRASEVINLLVDATFLGLETDLDQFRFVYDEDNKKKLQALAKTTAEVSEVERFKIHEAFHPFLEIEPFPPIKVPS